MAVASVDIQVDARSAVEQLKRVNQQSQQLKTNADAATQSLKNQGTTAQRIGTQFSGLASAVGKLAVAYVGLRTAQEAVQAGIQREESSRRLQFLAKGYGEIAAAQDAAARAGRQFGLSATESNQQFAQLYGRLRPLNVSLSDIEAAFVGFNTAAKVSGATAAESSGALLQLTQALGSGVLRGQELNSVLEQAPGLVVALTKELGQPVGEIRKLAEQGEITSEAVIRALKRAGTEGADELAAAMNGPAQAIKNLQNEFEDFQVAATQDLIPAITGAVRELRSVLESLGPTIRAIGGIAAQTLGTVADLINAATKPGATAAAIAIRGGRLPLAGFGGMSGAGELFKGTSGSFGQGLTGLKAEAEFLAKERRQPVTKVLLDLMRNRLQRMETPLQAPVQQMPSAFVPSGTGQKKKKGKTEAERAAEKLKKEIERSLEVGDRLGVEFSRQVVLLETSAEVERKRLQIQYDYEDRLKQIGELKNAEQRVNLTDLNNEIKRLEIIQLQNEELKAQTQEYYKRAGLSASEALPSGAGAFRTDIDLLGQQEKALQSVLDKYPQIGEAASAASQLATQGTMEMINGTKNAQQVFADFLNSIVDILIKSAAQMIAQYIAIGVARMFAGVPSSAATGGAKYGASAFSGAGMGSTGFSLPFLGARANGGSVMAGQPYLVGERGPELFMPGRSGGIAPTGSFGGGANIVVNVDASGSSVQGDSSQGKQLGSVIAAAVQAELVKQQRPGGLLAR